MTGTPHDLAALHHALSRVPLGGRDLRDVLTDVVGLARDALPGADCVSVTLVRRDEPVTAAHTGPLALAADELQYELDHGPCVDAVRGGQLLVVDDVTTDERWPQYARRVAATGVRSALSLPMPVLGRTVGGLNFYSTRSSAFGPDDVALAQEVAAWPATAVAHADAHVRSAEDAENMRRAMASRAVIEQAKGVLVERYRVTPDDAFTLLTRASQHTNTKLRDVAEQLVSTGVLLGATS